MLIIERVLIGIGSNLSNPIKQIQQSLYIVSCCPYIKIVACSSYYRSPPLGDIKQPDFFNVVVMIDTSFSPIELLDYIQLIEIKQGRIRNNHYRWGPRTLDIDILLFGTQVICTPRLVIPHYDMFNREFVIYPLFELCPNFCFNGNKLSTRLNILSKNGLIKY